MNPIECIWTTLKHYIRKYIKPKNRAELIDGINEYWATVNVQRCNTYIDHLYKVMPDVVRRGGDGTGM